MTTPLLANVVNALVFAIIGIIIFVLSFAITDLLTPYHLWREIVENKNTALATFLGAVSLGICIIIAAAIH